MRFDSEIHITTVQKVPNGVGGFKEEVVPSKSIDCFITPIQHREEIVNERATTIHSIKFFTKGEISKDDKRIVYNDVSYTVQEFADYGKLKMAVAKCDTP